jgi:hypothetical protein
MISICMSINSCLSQISGKEKKWRKEWERINVRVATLMDDDAIDKEIRQQASNGGDMVHDSLDFEAS